MEHAVAQLADPSRHASGLRSVPNIRRSQSAPAEIYQQSGELRVQVSENVLGYFTKFVELNKLVLKGLLD